MPVLNKSEFLQSQSRQIFYCDVKVYFATIPAHKYLHIRNYESNGYWDFREKQSSIPGQDCATICGLLDSIKGKLDDMSGTDANGGSGRIMAYINEPTGRICSWGIPLAESYGVRLPADYCGEIPKQMQIMDVPEGSTSYLNTARLTISRRIAMLSKKSRTQ